MVDVDSIISAIMGEMLSDASCKFVFSRNLHSDKSMLCPLKINYLLFIFTVYVKEPVIGCKRACCSCLFCVK
ncbi:MAG: hypothetical protein B6I36_04160 [Desulfobacteraceae bacterium 4572_35.1]|nr:MAG: hypothetical protein B6I36_04160 [Desulfobacteraceae bacterium 4572_35.1]